MAKTRRGDTPLRRVLRLLILAVGIIIMIYCAMISYRFGQKIFSDKGVEEAPGTDKIIEVTKGTTIKELGDMLEENGIIESSLVFYIQSKLFQVDTVEAGDYKFNTSESGEDILDIIEEGSNYEVETESTTESE